MTHRTIFALVALLILSNCSGHVWRIRLVTAKASLRKIEKAENIFRTKFGKYGTLPELNSEGLIQGELAQGIGDGYTFEVSATSDTFAALAIPRKDLDQTLPAYYLDQTGVLRQNDGTRANANDEHAPET